MLRVKILITIFCLGFLSLSATLAEEKKSCKVTRAAYDIGSGTTKMAVADVDVCKNKILQVHDRAYRKVSYEDDLFRSKDQKLSRRVAWRGVDVLKHLKKKAEKYGATEHVAVATSVFRRARNSEAFMRKVSKWTGIKVNIVSQNEEGALGFKAVCAVVETPCDQLVSWDIGAGSMQIVGMDEKQKIQVFRGRLASINFRNRVIKEIKGEDPKVTKSPNPMNAKEVKDAIRLAKIDAKEVGEFFLKKIANSTVYGIGGVHYYSVAGQVGLPIYDADMVEAEIKNRIGWDDRKLGGDYSSTQVTNLILVSTFMRELGANDVMSLDINMVNGTLISPKYWDSTPQ